MKLFLVDAFADKPFSGNPAAVCVMDAARDDAWMRGVAAELNQAETAFVRPASDGFELRWFTPLVEVDLCGHGTLATAHVLWEQELLPRDISARFRTRSGVLTAVQSTHGIELNFPATPPSMTEAPPGLLEALGVGAQYVGRSPFDFLVHVATESEVCALRPDLSLLKSIDCRGVIVTATSDRAGYDFVSRFFAPAAGIDEDAVTGSSHCCLAPYWSTLLNKTELTAYQASARGGTLHLRPEGERVHITGRALTVFEGELVV